MQRAIVLAVSAVNTLKGLICVGSFFDSLKVRHPPGDWPERERERERLGVPLLLSLSFSLSFSLPLSLPPHLSRLSPIHFLFLSPLLFRSLPSLWNLLQPLCLQELVLSQTISITFKHSSLCPLARPHSFISVDIPLLLSLPRSLSQTVWLPAQRGERLCRGHSTP